MKRTIWVYYVRYLLSTPPHIIAKAVSRKLIRLYKERQYRKTDQSHPTFENIDIKAPLFSYFSSKGIEISLKKSKIVASASSYFLAHRFDLLGSGWKQQYYSMVCSGTEGHVYPSSPTISVDSNGFWLKERVNSTNLSTAQHIWSFIDSGYQPIDWQLDFKSGYRWSEQCWYKDIKYGDKAGVDVKVPWELARMQHLPQLALAFKFASSGSPEFQPKQIYAAEFRNQVLDFIATNPPRYGVNWTTTMDVAIRASNWLVAYDLFKDSGARFDVEFKELFKRSIYEHGKHIVNHLEWHQHIRGNHYLSDIAGLLFVAAYLPCTEEVNSWLAFAVQELVKEVGTQFFPDGSNFEASTSYHRLSTEMVIYGTALVLGLPEQKKQAFHDYNHQLIEQTPKLQPAPIEHFHLSGNQEFRSTPFPDWYIERLEKMAEFTIHMTKSGQEVPQIGDNDNGRFLKLDPAYFERPLGETIGRYLNLANYGEDAEDVYLFENQLDHRHLVSAINGLFGKKEFAKFSDGYSLETRLVHQVSGNLKLCSYRSHSSHTGAETARIGSDQDWSVNVRKINAIGGTKKQSILLPFSGDSLFNGLCLFGYSDFGLYIFQSDRLFLAIRCGPIGQNENGGHAHNDQLSVELAIDGKDMIVDPGTFLYTPLPETRNKFRSVKAHFAPRIKGKEPGNLRHGLFRLGNQAKAKCIYFGERGFIGQHEGYGHPVRRLIELDPENTSIRITDSTEGHLELQKLTLGRETHLSCYSPGYGWLEKNRTVS